MLTLSWSDGNTLVPVNSCLLASAKDTNIIGPVKDFDSRTIAGKRRKLAQTKAPVAMMTLHFVLFETDEEGIRQFQSCSDQDRSGAMLSKICIEGKMVPALKLEVNK